MPWLFVVGVGLEIAGGLLVAGSLLLPIVLRNWGDLAARGHPYPRGGLVLEAMREPAYALVGSVVLISGFVVQLAGYDVEFHTGGLIAGTAAVTVGACVLGFALAHFGVARFLLGKAKAQDRTDGGA